MKKLLIAVACLWPFSVAAHWDGARPDGHAPISVMGDHMHAKGEWMLAYRYMDMRMSDLIDGEDELSREEAFALVPGAGGMNMKAIGDEMTMRMHMLGAMYAPSDTVTWTLMLPFVSKQMEMDSRSTMMGNTTERSMESETAGLGDIGLTALVRLWQGDQKRLHLNLGVGLPTGSIGERDFSMMAGENIRLPYGMQLGSGSVEVRPGITWFQQFEQWSYGAQLSGRVPLDTNSQGYRLGSRKKFTSWTARNLSDSQSVSLSLTHQRWSDIHGRDRDLTVSPLMNVGADPDKQAGWRTQVGVGYNFYARRGAIKGHRFALEYLLPVAESRDGPALSLERTLVFGWQKAYGP
jgi:hypothetical protein